MNAKPSGFAWTNPAETMPVYEFRTEYEINDYLQTTVKGKS